MSARTWPRGLVSGWCLVGDDHGRCRLEHTADPARRTACHCPTCVAVLDAAAAPPAHEPGAAAATPSLPHVCPTCGQTIPLEQVA